MKISNILTCCCYVLLFIFVYSDELRLTNVQEQLNELQVELLNIKDGANEDSEESLAASFNPPQRNEWTDDVLFNQDEVFQQEDIQTPVNPPISTPPKAEKVLLYSTDRDAAIEEVISMGGTVPLTFGDDLLVAKLPADKVRSHLKTATTHIPKTAPTQTLKYVKSYWKSVESQAMQLQQPDIDLNLTKLELPKALKPENVKTHARLTMTGHIGVIVLIVSGPGRLAMSSDEIDHIMSEVTKGCDFWIEQAPESASLKFNIRRAVTYINRVDAISCSIQNYAACHNWFALPALYSLGYRSSSQLEVNTIRQLGLNGAFTAFISKYKLYHTAYAFFRGGPTFIQYNRPNSGYTADDLHRIFAHESGHVFNAPDEYTSCYCSWNYGYGYCRAKNTNCVACTTKQEECIMSGGVQMKVCPYTRKHLGWCD